MPKLHTFLLSRGRLFGSSHATELITSDPNIAEIQGITGSQVSVSDYANHNYIPVPNKLTPEQDYFCRSILRGDNSAGSMHRLLQRLRRWLRPIQRA
jgi:hypothetical protein